MSDDREHMVEEGSGECRFCLKPLDDARPWQRSFDGSGAHLDCLPNPEEEPDGND